MPAAIVPGAVYRTPLGRLARVERALTATVTLAYVPDRDPLADRQRSDDSVTLRPDFLSAHCRLVAHAEA